MSESRKGGSGSEPEARGSGSSLTDAVVAALANVSSASVPPTSVATAPTVAAAVPVATVMPVDLAPASPTVITNGEPDATPSPAAADVTLRDDATIPTETAVPEADVAAAAEPASEPTVVPEPTQSTLSNPSTEPSEPSTSGESSPAPAVGMAEPTEPTMRLGGAPIEHLTKEAASDAAAGIVIEYYGRTDVGLVREHNEDNYLVVDLSTKRRGNDGAILRTHVGEHGLILAVCDGMGGAAAGEVASQMAVDTIHEILQAGTVPKDRDTFARRLVRAIEEAGARIFSAAKMDRTRRGMGTTSTVAGIVDSVLFVGQVGDSRAYVLRGDQFALITKDQSLVNQLIEAGQLTEEEAEAFEHSNIILQALGTTEEVTVDLTFLEVRRGDKLLMCSDGLSGLVHADMMKEVLRNARDLSEAAQQLIAMANAGGGHDNITVIVAEFDGAGLRETSTEARVAYQQYPLPPEDPSTAESTGKSATAIKSGGPKPGADVKSGDGRRDAAGEGGPAASRLWLVAVVVLILLVGVAALIVFMDDGGQTGAADEADTTRVTIASQRGTPPVAAPPAEGTIVVTTDAEGAVLYVDGVPHGGEIVGRSTLRMPAGAYRLELRHGDTRIQDSVAVTLDPGEEELVDLPMPSGAVEVGTADAIPALDVVRPTRAAAAEPSAQTASPGSVL